MPRPDVQRGDNETSTDTDNYQSLPYRTFHCDTFTFSRNFRNPYPHRKDTMRASTVIIAILLPALGLVSAAPAAQPGGVVQSRVGHVYFHPQLTAPSFYYKYRQKEALLTSYNLRNKQESTVSRPLIPPPLSLPFSYGVPTYSPLLPSLHSKMWQTLNVKKLTGDFG